MKRIKLRHRCFAAVLALCIAVSAPLSASASGGGAEAVQGVSILLAEGRRQPKSTLPNKIRAKHAQRLSLAALAEAQDKETEAVEAPLPSCGGTPPPTA